MNNFSTIVIPEPRKTEINLSALETTFDSLTTEAQSADIDTSLYRKAVLMFTLVSSGYPTDITIELQVKSDAGTYYTVRNDFLGKWVYDDQSVSSQQNIALHFDIPGLTYRVAVTAVGTTLSYTFTMDDVYIHLSN